MDVWGHPMKLLFNSNYLVTLYKNHTLLLALQILLKSLSSNAYSVITLSWNLKKFFQFFQQPLLIISSILTSTCFALLLEATQQLWGEKLTILLTMNISLIHLLIVSMEAPLNGFLWVIMSWSVVNPSRTIFLKTCYNT